MENAIDCTIEYDDLLREKPNGFLKKRITHFLSSFKIERAEQLSKTK